MKALAVLLLAAAGLAQAAVMANYKREYFAQSPTGIALHVCVYEYQGREIEKVMQMGTACPTYIMVQ